MSFILLIILDDDVASWDLVRLRDKVSHYGLFIIEMMQPVLW